MQGTVLSQECDRACHIPCDALPALQRGVAHSERGSFVLLCVGDHHPPADVQGLLTDVFRAVAAHQSYRELGELGRANRAVSGTARASRARYDGKGGRMMRSIIRRMSNVQWLEKLQRVGGLL